MTGPKIRPFRADAVDSEKILRPRRSVVERPAFQLADLHYGFATSAKWGERILHRCYRVKYKGWVALCSAGIAQLADMSNTELDAKPCGRCQRSFVALFPENVEG